MESGVLLQQAEAPFSLREELKQRTREEHEALETALDLLRPDFGLTDYQALLEKYHDFYVVFEQFMAVQANRHSAPALFYCARHSKKNWLADDLSALEIDAEPEQNESCFARLSELFPSPAHLLGAIYVIEGSMLGGAILSKHFAKQLGLAPEKGIRFFTGYGRSTKESWQETLAFIESGEQQGWSRADAVEGAKRMFALLGEQLV